MSANPTQMLEFGPVAFVGTVTAVAPVADRNLISFDVETVLAGEVSESVDIVAPANEAGCGIDGPVGNRLAVFAVDEGGGILSSNMCSITDADSAIAALGPGTAPAPASPTPFDWQVVWLGAGAALVVAAAWLLTRQSLPDRRR